MNKKITIEQLGKIAFRIISDYPLYAKTSGITYEEGIEIAKIIEPDVSQWAKIVEEL